MHRARGPLQAPIQHHSVRLPPSVLHTLSESVREHTPWRSALLNATKGTAFEGIAERADVNNLANWIWLVPLKRRQCALDVCGNLGTATASLARHFGTVYFLEPDGARLNFAKERFSQDGVGNVVLLRASQTSVPFASGAFDCVVLHNILGRLSREPFGQSARRTLRTLFATGYRILRRSGCLYMADANPDWYGHGQGPRLRALAQATIRAATQPSWRQMLMDAGFRSIQSYYVYPFSDQPESIVPATSDAVLAHQRLLRLGHSTLLLRRMLIRSGLHALLFPARLILAIR